MNKLLVALPLALAALSIPALAQDAAPKVSFDTSILAGTDFSTLDTDKSGGIAFNELALVVPDLSQDDFNAIDTDKNGQLSPDEYAAIVPADVTGDTTSK